ncbi:MAG: leucyl aminopeptidase [Burkholderiales bacterium]|nr:leucyl aminopeptidase [Burkholderiales bacterium]
MEFSVTSDGVARLRSACVVAGVYEGRRLSPAAAALDAASGGALGRVLGRGDLEGAPGTTLLLHDVPQLPAHRVLLVGLGPEGEFHEGPYRAALSAAMKALATTGAADVVMGLHELTVKGRGSDWKVEQAVLAVMESTYRFDSLKSRPQPRASPLQRVVFHVGNASEAVAAEAAIARATAIADGIRLAKDLANLPGNLCTPPYVGAQARIFGERNGLEVQVLGPEEITRLGMNGLLAVARGSSQPPQLIVMEYRGAARDAPPVVLVGKGITFDSGGLCIKPAREMDEMKFDMCGAASVFGALRAAALMKLPLNVVGIVPATENMPDGNAIKPGDVVTTMSGQTVEILDTDSEGRLVLCEALTYAERYRPAVVVDIATLTGAIVAALGDVASGVFASTDALAREIVEAGDRAWDRAWPMPLWDEYQDALKSNFADLPNIGTHDDCAVTAACFLSRFTRRYPWVHLDIAGTAARTGTHKGATGRPVALLAHFLAGRAANL